MQYHVSGMSCAACVSRVEKAVKKVPGVTDCSVSLLTNSMGVEGTAEEREIIAAVEKAGYHASFKDTNTKGCSLEDRTESDIEDTEKTFLLKRLCASVFILLLLMYFSMGHTMLGLPVPTLFVDNVVSLAVLELLLSAAIMFINRKFFINGVRAAFHLSPNMDTLVALGSLVSFTYSVVVLFAMTQVQITGGVAAAEMYLSKLYFESAAMILVFILIGKSLEARSKGKTTDALKSLMKLAPKKASVILEGKETTVPIDRVKVGDVFVVKPGESIPVDGVIINGKSAVNESSLTGESVPVDKKEGDEVSAATINQSGYLKCRAMRVGKDTTLSQIIEMVSDAAATKAPIAKIADKVAGIFVPCVLGIALITFLVWMIATGDVGRAINFATSVLVISCPCSLGLATPVAIMVGNGIGAKNGILFKTAAALEQTGKTQIVALDKTGTITKGEPQVTDICPENGIEEILLLQTAYALESKSEHPLAKAIVSRAVSEEILLVDTKETEVIPGKGIKAKLQDHRIYGGNEDFIRGFADIPSETQKKAAILSEEGKTPLYFAKEGSLLGLIAVADVIKEDAKQAIRELKNMGIHVVMITGDNEKTAKAIACHTGVERVISGVLPGGKEEVIKKLKKHGNVAMVGDGINDAPALTRADVGIAIGSGTDVAIDAADVVLIKNQLRNVPAAIRLGRATLRNIHQNLFWAFFYNSVGIPIAAGVLASSTGLVLNPMIGALAMSLSSLCVVTNALRLNLVNIFDAKKDHRSGAGKEMPSITENLLVSNTEDKKVKKTIRITGMMCSHCEARVKAVLETMEGIEEAVVSYEEGTAIVTLSKDVSNDALKAAIENEDYDVVGIE